MYTSTYLAASVIVGAVDENQERDRAGAMRLGREESRDNIWIYQ
jgi:hypothetical protein